jgi:hypothetical protein
MALETVTYLFPGPDRAGDNARVHVASWREAYAGIVPDELIVSVDMADRTTRWRGYPAQSGNATFLAEAAGKGLSVISGMIDELEKM